MSASTIICVANAFVVITYNRQGLTHREPFSTSPLEKIMLHKLVGLSHEEDIGKLVFKAVVTDSGNPVFVFVTGSSYRCLLWPQAAVDTAVKAVSFCQ